MSKSKKVVLSIDKLQIQNPTLSKQQILENEQLIAPSINIDASVFKKTTEEKKLLKSMKKYHQQFGEKLNSQKAKHAFFMESKGLRKKNYTLITV